MKINFQSIPPFPSTLLSDDSLGALKRSEENKEESESSEVDQEVEAKPEEGKANPSSDSQKATDQGREAGPKPPSIYKPNAVIQERGGDIADIGNLLDLVA